MHTHRENIFRELRTADIYITDVQKHQILVEERSLVIPRSLAWLKIGNFEKGDYGALFVEWSNPILYGQPNYPITASPQGIQPIICDAVVRDLHFEQEPKQSITNQFVQHPLESPKGKRPKSLILDVFHGELSVVETLKNEALYEEFDPKKYDKNVDESGDGKIGDEDIHLDRLETVDDPFVQTPDKQNSEVNVVNKNQPPSSKKVVGQLIRKRFVGKALVEPYTVQPPTTAPSAFLKFDRKRLKRKARMLQIQNTQISFDDVVGDDDPDFKVLFGRMDIYILESTKLKKKQNKKEPIRQSQIALPEIPFVEFHEDSSRAPYSQRTKVFFSINEPKKHYCLGVLHIRSGVITLYDSLYFEAVETGKWWIKTRKAFKKYIRPYLQEWGILDAKAGVDVVQRLQGNALKDYCCWLKY
nr:hypothetical protein [Tanacetum cinerariifolium]